MVPCGVTLIGTSKVFVSTVAEDKYMCKLLSPSIFQGSLEEIIYITAGTTPASFCHLAEETKYNNQGREVNTENNSFQNCPVQTLALSRPSNHCPKKDPFPTSFVSPLFKTPNVSGIFMGEVSATKQPRAVYGATPRGKVILRLLSFSGKRCMSFKITAVARCKNKRELCSGPCSELVQFSKQKSRKEGRLRSLLCPRTNFSPLSGCLHLFMLIKSSARTSNMLNLLGKYNLPFIY